MTAAANRLWPGVASAALTVALALVLFGWNGAVSRPPPDPKPPAAASADTAAPPPPVTLPPPPAPPPPRPTAKAPAPPDSAPVALNPREGRVLLRQMEAGDGPAIEIAWPSSRREREQLHALFIRCYGMVSAILDGSGRLFRAADPPGQRWALNRDRYSGFLRQVSGARVAAEKRILTRIRGRHRIAAGSPVRLFPRAVDAMLLGGLRRLIDKDYEPGVAIRARYELSGAVVQVTGITVGGRALPGSVELRPACGNRYYSIRSPISTLRAAASRR